MKIVGMIPARMGSSRYPGKPLVPLLGRPMLEHVYKRCTLAEKLDAVYVATCDVEIYDAVTAFGGKAVMTADNHERASDRIAEAACEIEADVYVMIQGDEPMTTPNMINAAVQPLLDGDDVSCVNLTKRIDNDADYRNPDTIKVVMDKNSNALFMSRAPIPSHEKVPFEAIEAFKQVCIIPFTRESLSLYSKLEPTPLEIAESIDMMRFIENGYVVRMVETTIASHAVDRPEDLAFVTGLMSDDPLLLQYMND